MIMWIFILICIVFVFIVSVLIRTIVFNLPFVIPHIIKDTFFFFRNKKFNIAPDGKIIAFCGLFGKGKTLSAVHYIYRLYKKYNNCLVYDKDRHCYVRQYVQILSNVTLVDLPYIKLDSLQQIVDLSKTQIDYDNEHCCRTVNYILVDEASTQFNSRNFKSNFNPLFLNTLLTCRHFHMTFVYTAQRFNQVDALLRQVTSYVYDCNKMWRIMIHKVYDAWDMENTSNITNLKPIKRLGYFVFDSQFSRYDTLATVENLTHDAEENAFYSTTDILAMQGNVGSNDDAVMHPSRRLKKSRKGVSKL